MRLKPLVVLLVAACLFGCKKESTKKGPAQLQITVKLTGGTTLANSTIKLLAADRTFLSTGVTDPSGKVNFTVTSGTAYYLNHDDGDSRVINDAAYIVTGTFTSQAQIDSSPAQTPPGTIGGSIYQDVNGDGVANGFDKLKKVTSPSPGSTENVDVVLVPM